MRGSSSTIVWRWSCLGQDRLYVSLHDGRSMGWSDVNTGLAYPSSPECLSTLVRAVEDWKTGGGARTSSAPPPVSGSPVPPVYGRVRSSRPTSVAAAAPVRPTLASTPPVPPVPPVPPAASPTSDRPWANPLPPGTADLLGNAAGAASRAQAIALREAAPFRTFLARLVDRHTAERAWRLGADGEELVAAQLARLVRRDPRWRVLHAIPVGVHGADIDHLVVGPGGVYSLNTKHHPDATIWVGGDTFLVKGHPHPYVRNSRHEAVRAGRLLTAASGVRTQVSGVIVPVKVRSVTIKAMPADVTVVPWRQIGAWLAGRPPLLDDHTTSVLFEAARRLSTWQPQSPPARSGAKPPEQYRRVRPTG